MRNAYFRATACLLCVAFCALGTVALNAALCTTTVASCTTWGAGDHPPGVFACCLAGEESRTYGCDEGMTASCDPSPTENCGTLTVIDEGSCGAAVGWCGGSLAEGGCEIQPCQ